MALNRFDQRAKDYPWVESYVPLPLEFIAQQGAMKQKEYNTNKKELEDSLLASRIKSIEEHDPYRNQYIKSFNDQAQTLLSDPTLDLGSFDGKQKVSKLIYEHANNPYLQTLSRSIKNKEDQLKNIEEVKKKGDYSYWNDPLLRENKLKEMGINPYMDEQGRPIEYQFKPLEARQDHNKPVYDLFDKIENSGQIKAYAGFSGDKTYIQSGKKGWEGVTPKTIEAVANRNIDSFATTAGGQDFLRKLRFDYADQLANLTPEQTQQFEQAAVKDHLYDIGVAYIRNKTMEDADLKTTAAFDDKIKESGIVPVYTTPASDIKGVDYGDYFSLQKKGSYTPYSDEERKEMLKGVSTIGKQYELVASKLAIGKPRVDDAYQDISAMPKPAKDLAMSTLKVLDKTLYEKVNSGQKLTEEEKARVYPQMKIVNDIAKNDIIQSSTTVGLAPKEAQVVNLDLFGNKAEGSNTVEKLGTGNAGNLKFYDKEEGKTLSLEELKDKYDGKETVSVRGRLTADNPYSFITNDDQFADAKQLFIGGKEYIVSGPKEYVDANTGSPNNTENLKLQKTKIANDIYKSKFSPVPQEKTIYNEKVIVGFTPYDMSDRSKGQFNVIVGDKHEVFATPQEAEEFILNEALSKGAK